MCGIHAAISRTAPPPPPPSGLHRKLCNRGPDHLGTAEVRVASPAADRAGSDSSNGAFLRLTSTVLALRGNAVTRQPFVDAASGNAFCWNGEAWRFDGQPVDGNDGAVIFAALAAASGSPGVAVEDAILDVLRKIEGPFAFVYVERRTQQLFYGRDRLGRRSLLVGGDDATFTLSSVADTAAGTGLPWTEVEADGVYVLSLDGFLAGAGLDSCLGRRQWAPGCREELVLSLEAFNVSLPPDPPPPALEPGSGSVRTLRRMLTDSLVLRALNVPSPPSSPPSPPSPLPDAPETRVAVLFSGGLDSTVVSRLASDMVPEGQGIDLINVAFENPRLAVAAAARDGSGAAMHDVYEACPDRITGRRSLAELRATCPDRAWRFIAINVPYSETQAHRAEVISLMYPHNTEMDLSIAYALYFAARGRGLARSGAGTDATDATPVRSPARVLLSGLGADELFGGYSRHGLAYARRGYAGLADELKLEVGRLGRRNLGRDDRIMSHWGREVRFPFLDERLVAWAVRCPVWDKCDFGHPAAAAGEHGGLGAEKRVLRLLALELGMSCVARGKKKAIQFGSRAAKMECGRAKGTALVE